MSTDNPPVTHGNFYHIYNRGNNRENIFIQERNYAYFMELWWKHISPIAETWAYCLLKNHFHAVVYIKDNSPDLTGLTSNLVNQKLRADKGVTQSNTRGDLSGLNTNNKKLKEPSQYFSNFFNAYSRGVNIATQRTGALFERPFNRILVDSESYLMRLIVYVHQNPQKHKFEKDFRDWNYSSYHELIDTIPTRLQRDGVLKLFESRANLIKIHQEIQPLENIEDED